MSPGKPGRPSVRPSVCSRRPIGWGIGHASCCTIPAMRRSAVLAFSLFAIAASLPAEVRECLPRAAGCDRHAASAGPSCSRRARPGSCARSLTASCPKTRPTHDSSNCRLHPTPPVLRQPAAAAIAAPVVAAVVLPLASCDAPQPSRRGERETPALRPRASPAALPRSPRPPPFTV